MLRMTAKRIGNRNFRNMHLLNKFTLFVTGVLFFASVGGQDANPAAVFPAIMQRERASFQEPCDDYSEIQFYDFIIVGGGAAGCVLANRLTEIKDWNVLLLEAGGEGTAIMDVPYLIGVFQQTDANWHYKTVPEKNTSRSLVGQQMDYPSGRGVGGSTIINYMFYVRGNKQDYNNWEQLGNPGWGYSSVLPYFKKLEDMQIPELKNSSYHSTNGPIKISYPPYRFEMSSIIIQAGKERGYPEVDYNGENQTGIARFQTTTVNGSRWTATKGYLYPIRERENFHLKKRALVTKILIEGITNTAYGVRYTKGGKSYTAYALKEVILSAGAINTPQLLMISGVGPKDHLQSLGIRVYKDSKVGYNLMDHIGLVTLLFTVNESKALTPTEVLSNPLNMFQYFVGNTGPWTSLLGFETISFHDLENTSSPTPGWPKAEVLYMSSGLLSNPAYLAAYGLNLTLFSDYLAGLAGKPTYQPFTFQLRPKSRGRITLKDSDISSPPLIDPNFYSDEEDIRTQIAAIREVIKLAEAPSLKRIGAKLYDKPVPFCESYEFGTDEYWRCALLQTSIPIYHQCGTCKMGPRSDKSAVVDSKLRVYGVNNLRVVDPSVFPVIPSGHLQTPTYMLAEKASDLIKAEYGR